MSKGLPMLNSERKEMTEKLRQAKIEAESSWHCAVRSCIRTVNEADYLMEEQKSLLVKSFYDKE